MFMFDNPNIIRLFFTDEEMEDTLKALGYSIKEVNLIERANERFAEEPKVVKVKIALKPGEKIDLGDLPSHWYKDKNTVKDKYGFKNVFGNLVRSSIIKSIIKNSEHGNAIQTKSGESKRRKKRAN